MVTSRTSPASLAAALLLAGVLVASPALSADEAPEAPKPAERAGPAAKPAEEAESASPSADASAETKPAEPPTPAEETKPTEPSAESEEKAEPSAEQAKPSEESAETAPPAEAPAPPAEAPSPPPLAAGQADRPKEVRFQFDGIPYNDVIRRFAQMLGKPIIGDYNVEGTLTFFDPQPYALGDAFDTLNLILAMRGYAVVETDRYLRVVPIKDVTKAPLRIIHGWDEAEDLRSGELVTLMLPLRFMEAEDAVRVLMPVVSSFGSVAPLGTGRGIIVTDRVKNLQRIRLVLEALDTGTLSAESVLKTYRLKHASAPDVQKVVENLFGSSGMQDLSKLRYIRDNEGRMVRNPNYGQKMPKGPGELEVTSDVRTNTLFMAGPGEKIALAEQVVEQLDAVTPEQAGDMRIFELKNARAEDIANTIKQMLPGGSSDQSRYGRPSSGAQSRVVADTNTNRLIVTAPLDQMARIEKLIQALDQASQEVGGMRVFRLKVADARQLADVVSGALRRGGGYGDRYRGRSAVETAVSADSRTNSLIVSGAASDIQRAEQLITELDKPLDEQPREIHVVPLKAGEADDVANALNRMLGHAADGRRTAGPVQVASEDETNTLFISASPDDWPTVQAVLEELKASAETHATSTTRLIRLEHADAEDVEDALNDIYRAKMMAMMRMHRGRPFVPVVISASRRTNSLLVSAPDDEQRAIADLVKSMDKPAGEAGETVHVVRLKAGDAVRIADTIRALQPRTGRDGDVVIRGDADSNTIFVRASEEKFLAVKAMIDELDQAITTTGGLKAFRLKVADAQQLSGVLRSALYQRAEGDRGGDRPRPVVTADSRTNSLLVSGTAGDIQMAEQLVQQLDQPMDEQAREIHVVPLEAGDADDLADALNRMLSHSGAGGRRTAGPVHVAAEDGTNTLFISAAPTDWAAVEKALETLKASISPHATATTRQVKLQHADAQELADTLRQLYASQTSSSRYRGRSTGGDRLVPVTIAADRRTNSLIISAADDDQETIAQMIESLDVPSKEGAEPIRIIRLASADAAQLAETLRAAVPETGDGTGERIVIQADARAGAILIRAPETERKRLEEIIATLDQVTQEQARETRLIELKHVSASKLAQLFSQLYGSGSSSSRYYDYRYRGRSGGADEADRVVVAPAPDDRTLVVEAPRSKMKEIADLVASLDVEEAPVQVEVRTYRLADSEADDLARSLGRLMAEKRSPGAADEPQPRFEADQATNQLLVAATPEQFETIEALIEKLQSPARVARETRTFRLTAAKADDVARVLREMLLEEPYDPRRRLPVGERPPEVRVAAVGETNAVVVQGPPEKLAMAAQLIETLDSEAIGSKAGIVIVRLANAQAAVLAQSINEALAARQSGPRDYRYGGRPEPREDRVTVTPELNSNSVLVRGPADEIPAVVEMIKELDAGSTGTGAQVRVYPLENGEPSELARSLEPLFRDMLRQQSRQRGGGVEIPFSIAADDRTRSLVVSTTPAHFALIEQVLKSLDKAPAAPEADVQFFWLENADAVEVTAQLDQMYEDRKGDRPVVSADEFSNSVTVIAKEEDLKDIESVIAKLDEASVDNTHRVRVVPLIDVRADKMAELLRAVYKEMTGADVRITGTVSKESAGSPGDAGPGGVPGPASGGAGSSDEAAGEAPAKAETAEPVGQAAEGPPARTADSGAGEGTDEATPADGEAAADEAVPLTIAVDMDSNSLILSGKRQDIEYLEMLIEELSLSAMDIEAEFRSFRIEKADPQSVAQTLDELFNPKPKAMPKDYKGPPPPSPPPVISVVADPRTRLVIVRAKSTDFKDVEDLIKQLDQVPTVVSEVRIFQLKHTSAKEVAQNLEDLFTRAVQQRQAPRQPQPQKKPQEGQKGRSQPQRPNPQNQRAEMIRQVLELKTDTGVTQVDLVSMINVSANEQTNSVIVTAPADAMGIVADIIEELDQSAQGAVPSVRMYPIAHGEIAPMVKELHEIFAPEKKARGGPVKDVVITGDEAGRVIVVSAPAEDHERIGKVITEMDQAGTGADLAPTLIPLKFAQAATVAEAIGEAFGAQRGSSRQTSPRDRVTVVPEPGSNSLIVTASAENLQKVRALLDELDTEESGGVKSEMLLLANAKAEDLAPVLQQMARTSAPAATGMGGYRSPRAGSQAVTVSAEKGSNTLVISGPAAELDRIVQMAKDLDQATASTAPTVRIIQLKNGEATEVASMVQDLYRQQYLFAVREKRSLEPLAVSADARANALVLAAGDEMYEQVSTWVNQIESMQPVRGSLRIITLKHADPAEVEDAIQRLFGEETGRRTVPIRRSPSSSYRPPGSRSSPGSSSSRGSRGPAGPAGQAGPGGRVETTVLPQQRSILISASDEDFEAIKQLAEALDAAAADARRQFQVFALKHTSNTKIATALSTLYRQAVTGRPEDRVTVTALPDTNAVVVSASSARLEEVAHLIEQLDQEEIAPQLEFRICQLQNAQPTKVLPVLEKMLAQVRRTRPDEPPRDDVRAGRADHPDARPEAGVRRRRGAHHPAEEGRRHPPGGGPDRDASPQRAEPGHLRGPGPPGTGPTAPGPQRRRPGDPRPRPHQADQDNGRPDGCGRAGLQRPGHLVHAREPEGDGRHRRCPRLGPPGRGHTRPRHPPQARRRPVRHGGAERRLRAGRAAGRQAPDQRRGPGRARQHHRQGADEPAERLGRPADELAGPERPGGVARPGRDHRRRPRPRRRQDRDGGPSVPAQARLGGAARPAAGGRLRRDPGRPARRRGAPHPGHAAADGPEG